MAKSLKEFRRSIKPEVQTAARTKTVKLLTEMSLTETRKERGHSQSALGL